MDHIFTARPVRERRRTIAAIALVVFFALWHTVGPMFDASATSTVTISGTAFRDVNRDGVRQAGEAAFEGHVIYLLDSAGSLVTYQTTDAEGRYAFGNLPVGTTYEVAYMRSTWRDIWSEWVPTTTGSRVPTHTVTLGNADVRLHFGWRQIQWSTDLARPISEVKGPDGLTVQSYNDAVTADEVHDHIRANFHVGDEAATTRVRFAYGNHDRASTQIQMSNGTVTRVQTTLYASYERLLSQGHFQTLAHEYGHAWMNYHNYFALQDADREWRTYLEQRGIDPDDARLGTSHRWKPDEIAAEDYRQLLTAEPTNLDRHMNRDIPDAWDVPGLEAFVRDLAGERGPVSADPEPQPDPDPDPEPQPDPDPEPEPEPVAAAPIELSVRTYKVRGVNHAELSWSGARAGVDIHRDGAHLATTDGSSHVDNTGSRGSPTHWYRVCENGTDVCSDPVEVRF